jgi:hypothetical protein
MGEFGFEVGDDLPDLSALTGAASGAVGQAQGALSQAQGAATSAATGAITGASASANAALQNAGVPPDVANAATSALSGAALQGFSKVMSSVAQIPGHVFGGLFHHHKHVANIPAVAATIASLPPAQAAGAQAAANALTAAASGQIPATGTPAQRAAAMLAHDASAVAGWGRIAFASVLAGGGALLLGAALPIAAGAAVVGAGAGYLLSRGHA